jgi:Tfp pilus assembly PilM family ATPase
MKALESINIPGLFIDIGQTSFQAVYGEDTFAFPIERTENGRLTDLCRERLTLGLRGFLSKSRAASQRAYCAISARGVSIRRLSLPASSDEEQQRVLRLQIESEFPLSPDDLAWGSRRIGSSELPASGLPARQDFLVVAVKKEVLEEYATLLAGCGITAFFTLAALARAELYPPLSGACAVLDIGRTHSELTTFENGVPISIRILAWGGETITRSIQEKLAVSHDEAEKLKLTSDQPAVALGAQGPSLQSATLSALTTLAGSIKSASLGEKLYLTGKTARDRRIAPLLAGALGGTIPCESLEPLAGAGPSAAIAGLKKSAGKDSASPPLILALNGGQAAAILTRPAVWKWAAAAAILALAALIFPYAEALVFKPFLERKLASLEADRGRLVTIDQELDFLKSLKQSQPPYLDVIYLMARSAAQGTHLDELSMNRQRQISIRMKMANGQQVTEFRSKLIDSGWFTNVMVEEQAPSPDRRFAVRMTAELRPAEFRKALAAEPPGKRAEPALMVAAPEPMMMPAGPPMGMPEAAPAPNPAGEIAPSPPPDGQDTSTPGPARRRIRRIPASQP